MRCGRSIQIMSGQPTNLQCKGCGSTTGMLEPAIITKGPECHSDLVSVEIDRFIRTFADKIKAPPADIEALDGKTMAGGKAETMTSKIGMKGSGRKRAGSKKR